MKCKKKETIDARNQADSLIHQTEKNVKEPGDKVSESDRKKIEEDLEELKKSKDTDELEAIKSKTEALKGSTKISGEEKKEIQAYILEDRPKLVKEELNRYCL